MTKLQQHSSQCLFIVTLDLIDVDKMTYKVENAVTGHTFSVKSVPDYEALEDMPCSIRVSAETILLSSQPLAHTEALLINDAGLRLVMGSTEGYLYSSDKSAPVLDEIHVNFCEERGGIVLTDLNKNLLVHYSDSRNGHDED